MTKIQYLKGLIERETSVSIRDIYQKQLSRLEGRKSLDKQSVYMYWREADRLHCEVA
jgi:hypothetical protein